MQEIKSFVFNATLTKAGGVIDFGDKHNFKYARLCKMNGELISEKEIAMDNKVSFLGAQGWTAEKPILYRLTCGNDNQNVEYVIGFTSIHSENGRVFFNERQLKLKGVNYRQPTEEDGGLERLKSDLKLFKDAHINFLRSLFVPFDEQCLNLCDNMGFYVEQCAPFFAVGQKNNHIQNMPHRQKEMLEEITRMLTFGMRHPSLLIWGIGNESTWGSNFSACRKLIKSMDDKRLVNFHFPMTIPEEEAEPDIWSVAYADWRQPMDVRYDHMNVGHTHGAANETGYAVGLAPSSTKPVLHVAFAPPPVFNQSEIENDYGIHEFWGTSIHRFWTKMYHSSECLGGAIMAAVDEDGNFDSEYSGYNWGILDIAGNPKPEYTHVKSAFAPIHLRLIRSEGNETELCVENRFIHTNLSECSIEWHTKEKSGKINLNVEPGAETTFTVPVDRLFGEISFMFYSESFSQNLTLNAFAAPKEKLAEISEGSNEFVVNENKESISLVFGKYHYRFSKHNGLLEEASCNNKTLIHSGPYLQATRLKLGEWAGFITSVKTYENTAEIIITGSYSDVCRVQFIITIITSGKIDTQCRILTLNRPMPHIVKAGVGLDPGGLNELGIYYVIDQSAGQVSWERAATWNIYPDNHIGRDNGTALRENSNDFASMKFYLDSATVRGENGVIKLDMNGSQSLRIDEIDDPNFTLDDRSPHLHYKGSWQHMDDYCGNYMDTETLSNNVDDTITLDFTGTGIFVYGPLDIIYGHGLAWLDNDEPITFDQYLTKPDFPGASRGYEKRYNSLIFHRENLTLGEHRLNIVVKKCRSDGAQNDYVSIDRIIIENPNKKKHLKLIINSALNYARLTRGNYMNPPVVFSSGDIINCSFSLCGKDCE